MTGTLGGVYIISSAVINGNTYIRTVMGSTEEGRFRFQDSIDIIDAKKSH